MAKKLQLIRGQRILNQLNQLVETAFTTLRANAKKIPAGDRELDSHPINITTVKLTPYENTGELQVQCEAVSGSNKYQTTIMFQEVEYQQSDQGNNITFTGSDGDTYNMMPLSLSKINVKVTCECLDFYWRFAQYNANDGSLHGKGPDPYAKKTDRAPVNPQKVPGVCKHLIKSVDELKQSGIVAN